MNREARGPSGDKFELIFGGVTRKGVFVDYVTVHETHPTGARFLEKAAAKHLTGLPDKIAKKVKL